MENFEAFKELLNTPKKILITTHANPDADALGSSLGLWQYLKLKGHDVTIVTPTPYPKFLTWMPGEKDVIRYPEAIDKSNDLIAEAEIIFCLDFSGLKRIKTMEDPVRESSAKKVLIDHHLDPEDFADFQLWDTGAAATAELIYDLIVKLEDRELISAEIANNIYAGILTDTGNFKHPSTTAKVHRIVANLIDLGAEVK